MSTVTTYTSTGPEFRILKPGIFPARTGKTHGVLIYKPSLEKIKYILQAARHSKILAVDFETRGVDFSSDLEIVGLGFAWDLGSCYFDWNYVPASESGSSPLDCASDVEEGRKAILDLLLSHKGLIAHNVSFDGGVVRKFTGKHADWLACTYSLLSLLHNESIESKWGLKDAQVNLLGWTEANEVELDAWLIKHEYCNAQSKPKKGEMWRAPIDILGKYCILDAEACYLLYTEILGPTMYRFPGMVTWFREDFMFLINRLIEQKMHGILIDRTGLEDFEKELKQDIIDISDDFVRSPEVVEHIAAIQDELRAEVLVCKHPKLTSTGKTNKNYLRWEEKAAKIRNNEMPEFNFNLSSSLQLAKLFYEKLKFPVVIETDSEDKPRPSTATKALAKMGDLGAILIERSDRVKSLSFVAAYLELIANRDTMHPSFRAPGTVTGRLSGSNPNLQQMSKTYQMMSKFISRPGHIFVDLDVASLEPTITTEFSKCPNMEVIYGSKASPYQDFYLFIASTIPGMRERVISAGYNPENPTKEGTANCKKVCKADRNACKIVALACAYGGGVNKVMQILEEQNIFMDFHAVESIHRGYWELFAMVKDFSRSLLFKWKRNKGFILNGIGRPMACSEKYNRDLLNRFVQSTGHDVFVKYIRILCKELEAQGIPYTPIIIDFHDSSTIEVPDEYEQRAIAVFNKSMDLLNAELGGRIKLKGVPMSGKNLAIVKEAQ